MTVGGARDGRRRGGAGAGGRRAGDWGARQICACALGLSETVEIALHARAPSRRRRR